MLVHSWALILLVCECEVTKNIKAHLSFASILLQILAFDAKMPSYGNVNVNKPLTPIHFCIKLRLKLNTKTQRHKGLCSLRRTQRFILCKKNLCVFVSLCSINYPSLSLNRFSQDGDSFKEFQTFRTKIVLFRFSP